MLHPDEIAVDEELQRQLLQEQFPPLNDLKLSAVSADGTDNWPFRLGDNLLVRLPRRPSAALQYPYYKPRGHPLAAVAARTLREILGSASLGRGRA